MGDNDRAVWVVSLAMIGGIASVDALLGTHVDLIGLLAVAPCCAVLTGRWAQTALTAGLAVCVGVVLGFPDGIWATGEHIVFVGAVGIVGLTATLSAFGADKLIQTDTTNSGDTNRASR